MKEVGGLLGKAIIELQELQVKVAPFDDVGTRAIGVALHEVESKLHQVSDLLEMEPTFAPVFDWVVKYQDATTVYRDGYKDEKTAKSYYEEAVAEGFKHVSYYKKQ